jgi:enoyl-CoA hydratase/carnithine racemase
MAMPDFETLTLERPQSGTALITLNRPERLNALSFASFDELQEVCARLDSDPETRVVVVTGAGRGFCSGLDLDDAARLSSMTTPAITAGQEHWAATVSILRRLPQPIIAAVNGVAAGGGLSLALAADIRIASSSARFNAAFVRIGLSAGDLGVSWTLPRVIGLGRAAELMYTGRFVEAREAEAIGLVNRVVEPDDLLASSFELAEQIAANSPYGVRLSKQVLQANVDAPSLERALELENRCQVLATRTEDMDEALGAFRAGREPEFQNR